MLKQTEALQETAPHAVRDVSRLSAVCTVVLAWAVMTWPWLSGRVTVPWDAKSIFYPQLRFLASSLHRGESPAWSPYIFSGWPQISDPQSLIFSLPHLIAASLSPEPSFWLADVTTLVMLLAGGLAVLVFCADRGWGWAAGALAATVFMFGGSTAMRLEHVCQELSISLVAITWMLIARARERRSYGWGLTAGVTAGLMLAKPDQVAMLGCYAMACHALIEIVRAPRPWTEIKAIAGPMLLAGVIAVLIAAVPILLTLDLLGQSNRPAITFEEAGPGSLHPASLLGAFIPDMFGFMRGGEYWGPGNDIFRVEDVHLSPSMSQMYLGALPALLVLAVGLAARKALAHDIWPFAALLAAALIYTLGWWTPLFKGIHALVPGVGLFRRPADATFVLGLLGALLSGALLHRWLREPDLVATRRHGVVLAAALILLVGTALYLGLTRDRLAPALLALAQAAAMMAIMGAALWAVARTDARRRSAAALALSLLTALDLAWYNGPSLANADEPRDYAALAPATKDPLVTYLKQLTAEAGINGPRRIEVLGLESFWLNGPNVHGLEGTLGYNPLRLADYEMAFATDQEIYPSSHPHFTPLFPSYRSRLAELLGLKWLVTDRTIEGIDPKLGEGEWRLIKSFDRPERNETAYIYESSRALPRALLVPTWKIVDSEQILITGKWPAFDPRATVLLEETPEDAAKDDQRTQFTGQAEVVLYTNTRVEVQLSASQPAFLLLNDIWHQWWTATIDGRPTKVLEADELFRAVSVPAGSHRVVFEFKPLAGLAESLRRRFGGHPGTAKIVP